MPFTKLNIAVFAPIVSAMVAIATTENPGAVANHASCVTKIVTYADLGSNQESLFGLGGAE
jgi:hypothetical protein